MVWTVNRAERMREFAEWGVDAIISDETELLVLAAIGGRVANASELSRSQRLTGLPARLDGGGACRPH